MLKNKKPPINFFWKEWLGHYPDIYYIYMSQKVDLTVQIHVPKNSILISKSGIDPTAIGKKYLTELAQKCKEQNIAVVKTDWPNLYDDTVAIISLSLITDDKISLSKFLNLIDELMPFNSNILQTIKTALNLNNLLDDRFLQENIERIETGNIAEAIESAQSLDNDAFWQLGEYCEQNGLINEALSFFQEINKENPHYTEANYRCAHLCMSGEMNDLSEDSQKEHLETVVRFMLRANQYGQYQEELDQFYYQLCGGNDFQPTIKNIRLEESTFIALARDIAKLRKECQTNSKLTYTHPQPSSMASAILLFSPEVNNKEPTSSGEEVYSRIQYD